MIEPLRKTSTVNQNGCKEEKGARSRDTVTHTADVSIHPLPAHLWPEMLLIAVEVLLKKALLQSGC